MRGNIGGDRIGIGNLQPEQPARRFERQDHEGSLEDLRSALRQMHWASADPPLIKYIASLVAVAEQILS